MNDLAEPPADSSSGIDPALVSDQVARITTHPSFTMAPQLCRLLRYLVEHALAGDLRELKEYSLGVELFDRGANFDPRTDNIVRANVRRLRRRLEAYYQGPGLTDPIVIEVPKGHYLVTYRHNAPLVKSGETPRVRAGPSHAMWAMLIAIAAITAVLVATQVQLEPGVPSVTTTPTFSTALFRFDAPAGDADTAALALGVANDLASTMNQQGLPIIASGAFESLEQDARVRRAIELGAVYAIEGNIRREDGNLLVSVWIEDLSSRTVLWVESFAENAARSSQLPLRIATQTTDTLRCASPDPHPRGFGDAFDIRPDDVDSLRMLLEACSNIRKWQFERNRDIFRTLIARYPDSAALNGALALNVVNSLASAPTTARAALLHEAERAAQRAMAQDPNRGQSYMVMVTVQMAQDAPAAEIEAILRRGLERVPEHATLNSYYGGFLDQTGRISEAENYFRRAVVGDPLSPGKKLRLARNLLIRDKVEVAAKVLADTAERWPLPELWRMQMLVTLLAEPDKLAVLVTDPPFDGANPAEHNCWVALAAAAALHEASRRNSEGDAAIARCGESKTLDSFQEMELRLAFGDIEGVLARAGTFRSWSDPGVASLLGPRAAPIQHDPRFVQLLHRLGLFDLWTESHRWPDFCQAPGLGWDCHTEARR